MTNDAYTGALSRGIYMREYSNGWSADEEKLLFSEAENCRRHGRPLRAVFESIAKRTGRKPNSVRNHYYLRIKQEDMQGCDMQPTAFVPFNQQEVEELIEKVLVGRANGESVRACTIRLADGDDKLMLRYQNKYRAVLKKEPELIEKIALRLAERGIEVPKPYCRNVNTDMGDSRSEAMLPSDFAEYLPIGLRNSTAASALANQLMELVSLLQQRAEAADALKQRLDMQHCDMEAQRERFMLLHSMFQRLMGVSRELAEAVRNNRADGRSCAELLCGIEDCERIAGLIV